ncbi:uncharacterized protein METZ01_LOCUS79810 [marine metagenome]|uniref:Uncharacterized protein n=1 Tax=marine metagenome TaxID=408172 RepID=A0A381UFF5_9ZZZZ
MSNNRFNMDDETKISSLSIQIKINLEHKNQNKKKVSYHYQQSYNTKNNYNNNYYNNKRMNNNRFGNFNHYKQPNKQQGRKVQNYHQKNKKKRGYEPRHPQYNTFENDVLNTHWTIHIHNTSETDWTLESYKKVYVIKKISDFWTFFNNFTDFQKFNFYVMRGDIKPVYEDINNTNGYSYSYIIPGRKVNETFIHCLVEMMCEKLVDIQHHNEVCGVSLVPKPNGISIFKVWMRNKNNALKLKIIDPNLINGRYQDHKLY